MLRGALYALAGAFGFLHARDLQAPSLSTARLAAIAALATAPAVVALRAGRRLGLLALAPAALIDAWIASGSPPHPSAPLGGLAGLLVDAPAAWVQVVLPFQGSEHPELRAAVLVAAFAWLAALAWVWIARPRPLVAALLTALPFVLSATVYNLPQYPWRALIAGVLLLAFLRTGRAAGGGRTLATAFAALALAAGVAWAALPAASRPAVLPWTTWTFTAEASDPVSVDFVWNMSYRPLAYPPEPVEVMQVRAPRASYWRAIVLDTFDGLRFGRDLPILVGDSRNGGELSVPDSPTRARLRAEVEVKALADRFLVSPGAGRALPASGGGRGVRPHVGGVAQLRSQPFPGLEYVAEGFDPNPSAGTLSRLAAGYPSDIIGHDLRFAGETIPPFGAQDREAHMEALFQAHPDPPWGEWRVAYAKARAVTRGAASPYQAVVALEAWLRTTRTYDEAAFLPEQPDALARWAAGGLAGHCQMFAASLAALARLSGVPARVAEGFAPGEHRDGVYRVTDRDAHAWVEVVVPPLRLAAVRCHAGPRVARTRVVVLAGLRRARGAGPADRERADERPAAATAAGSPAGGARDAGRGPDRLGRGLVGHALRARTGCGRRAARRAAARQARAREPRAAARPRAARASARALVRRRSGARALARAHATRARRRTRRPLRRAVGGVRRGARARRLRGARLGGRRRPGH